MRHTRIPALYTRAAAAVLSVTAPDRDPAIAQIDQIFAHANAAAELEVIEFAA
jgi:hypothetical protein